LIAFVSKDVTKKLICQERNYEITDFPDERMLFQKRHGGDDALEFVFGNDWRLSVVSEIQQCAVETGSIGF